METNVSSHFTLYNREEERGESTNKMVDFFFTFYHILFDARNSAIIKIFIIRLYVI